MKISCTKEEFRKMSVNCSKAEHCYSCVFYSICDNGNFPDFIDDIDCSYKESNEVPDNAEISEH